MLFLCTVPGSDDNNNNNKRYIHNILLTPPPSIEKLVATAPWYSVTLVRLLLFARTFWSSEDSSNIKQHSVGHEKR